jgi:preprotein translocase subunit Sec63
MQNLQDFRDYYEILGVPKESSGEEIKKVYITPISIQETRQQKKNLRI